MLGRECLNRAGKREIPKQLIKLQNFGVVNGVEYDFREISIMGRTRTSRFIDED